MRDDREAREGRWGRLKVFVGLVVTAFAVALAVVVGNRLSEEALGVLAGTVCGVGAAIPTSLIVVAVSRRQGGSSDQTRMREPMSAYEPRHTYPPVIVVSPRQDQLQPDGRGSVMGGGSGYWPSSLSPGTERRFTIVGGAPEPTGYRDYDAA